MFRTIASLTLCFVLFGCALASQAQKAPRVPRAQARMGTDSDNQCDFNFHSGSLNSFLGYCASTSGNILLIGVPQGHELLDSGVGADGYGICDVDTGTAYFDYSFVGGDSGNWSDPVVVSQNSTGIKTVRTTSDGIWTLTQSINLVPSTPSIKVVMMLKNNTAVNRTATLVRFADINVDSNFSNNFSATGNGAAGWINSDLANNVTGLGLQLQNVGNSPFGFVTGLAMDGFDGPNPCAFAENASGTPLVGIDGSIGLAYEDTIAAKNAKTATMIYRGF
jgi:hypothetical protein